MNNDRDIAKLAEDFDWKEAFAYAQAPMLCEGAECSTAAIAIADLKRVIHRRDGEKDERNWLLVAETHDGRFFFLTAGCDFTGWDCLAGGQTWVSHDYDNLQQFGFTNEARDAFHPGGGA